MRRRYKPSFSSLFFDSVLHKSSRLYFVVRSPLLRKFGFHLPHFSTFIKSSLAKNLTFDYSLANYADQLYFIEAEKYSSVSVINSVSTLMQSGGSSNTSLLGIFKTNCNVFHSLNRYFGPIHAFFYISFKILYKTMQKTACLFIKWKNTTQFISCFHSLNVVVLRLGLPMHHNPYWIQVIRFLFLH